MVPFLKVAALQANLVWEDVDENLAAFAEKIYSLAQADLVVLPEMFTTGFSMQPERLAEKPDGKTIHWMRKMAGDTNSAITGSIITEENGQYFNRLIWMRPDGEYTVYDKKHLFSIAGENNIYTPGNQKLTVDLKGWRICPFICYDLRFPVWCHNNYAQGYYEYDALIFVANWPQLRVRAWETLLAARAMENLAYVIGVNRVGDDGNGVPHSGASQIIDPKGKVICRAEDEKEFTCEADLDAAMLKNFRSQFDVGPDWDKFSIHS